LLGEKHDPALQTETEVTEKPGNVTKHGVTIPTKWFCSIQEKGEFSTRTTHASWVCLAETTQVKTRCKAPQTKITSSKPTEGARHGSCFLATLLFFCFSAPEWKQSGIIRYYMVL
jgi:hypothetical protein